MKSAEMTLAPGVRSVCFRGFSLALMLLSTCTRSDLADTTVMGTDGEAASLPCKCPPDWPPYLVWQKVSGKQQLVVNYYKDSDQEDNDQEDNVTASEFRNRTELKLRGNCSLVFHRVTLSDQGLYECFYKITPLSLERIYLVVTEKPEQMTSEKVQSTIVSSSVSVVLIIVIAIAAVYVGITCRNRQRREIEVEEENIY